ncbi:hypothetical protein B0T10DRAFT_29903 [Thelonectria olida]|uniref:Mitochondrial distribution and morphology protein 12 n=1 Tax=Thelonectria olida TaxID=1576542 RepID=A0A9P8WJ82_9HYPO|nr:hypothetical protein B0T10DRAFT_29903 [Thelonectria olida]
MSIDLNWETVTSGPDGEALAEQIRTFIHDKFQTVPLPRFIRSVNVHGFDFGTIPPRLELKDITDPLPDFYDEDLDDDEESDEEEPPPPEPVGRERNVPGDGRRRHGGFRPDLLRNETGGHDLSSPFLGTGTPGLLGGSGLSYFQGHMGTGTHTPLAAVAGAHLGNSWLGGPILDSYEGPSHNRNPSHSSIISVDNISPNLTVPLQNLREKSSVSTLAPTSVGTPAGTSRPPTRDKYPTGSAIVDDDDDEEEDEPQGGSRSRREPRVEDVMAVFRIRYAGDVRLNLTAEILLDYPMPSFVGIPLKLNITGMSFDGVGVLANIRKRVHFCFLNPEDALAAVGPDEDDDDDPTTTATKHKAKVGGLLHEIKVESEIGERDGRKQSLKNVGKVERFVLEQVRRIFEEEFVYPSFWTFLV